MIAVFLGLVIDEDCESCDEGFGVIRVRFTPMNVQMKSLAETIGSDSEHIAGEGIKLQPWSFSST